ncbi:MAG: thiamine phosphate synthase [Gemmatimonadaceae bacterium]
MPAARTVDIPRVHAVTNDRIAQAPDFLSRALAVMRALGPQVAVHLRAHRMPSTDMLHLAERLVEEQTASASWLVVNDRLDIALAAGARGVQLTSKSMLVRDARTIAPGMAVGASVHDITEIECAALAGADWAVAGNVFETETHPGTAARGADLIREMAAMDWLPIIAIGGVLPRHVPALLAAGAHGVAAIRGIWESGDAAHAAMQYLSSHDARGNS